jgi:TRAP-type C4-dicarboxylate transport system permease small subunit
MFYEVIARYVFSKPTLWANEMSLWIAAFVFILAGLYAMQQRSHIRIYVVYDMMPRWGKKLSDSVTVLFIWLFWAALIWGGYNEARDKLLRMETFGTAWDPPIPATVKATMLSVFGLVALQALSNLIADWNKEPHSGGVDEIDEHEIEKLKQALRTDDNG